MMGTTEPRTNPTSASVSRSVATTPERDILTWVLRKLSDGPVEQSLLTAEALQAGFTRSELSHAIVTVKAATVGTTYVLWRATAAPAPSKAGAKSLKYAAEDPEEHKVSVVWAREVQPERIDYIWQDRIPLGMVTLLVGQAGVSKTMGAIDIAARLTRGTLPGQFESQPVNVAICSAEDHRAAVLVPRLIAAGADLNRVAFLEAIADDEPDDIALDGRVTEIERACVSAEIKLLIIDTVVAHMPMAHDSYKEQAVRAVLKPVKAMCERVGMGVLGLMHTNRREDKAILSRISGSGGFGGLARSVLLMGLDPNEPPETPNRVLVHGKSNVGKFAPTLRMHVEEREVPVGPTINGVQQAGRWGVLVTDGVSSLTAEALLSPAASEEERTQTDEAMAFLDGRLTNVPVLSATLKSEAKGEGISERTLQRAAQRMGVETRTRDYMQPGNPTVWSRPVAGSAKTRAPF